MRSENNNNSADKNRRGTIRIFLMFFLPLLVIIIGITALLYFTEARHEERSIAEREAQHILHLEEWIAVNLQSTVKDLMVLADSRDLRTFLDDGSEISRRGLAEGFLSFSRNKGSYDQIRYLDDAGMEIIRINYNDRNPFIVPDEDLQNKGGRYYFNRTYRLDKGQVYISPLDHNIEGGEVEWPLKPTIRFGTPIFDANGRNRGIMVLNFFGDTLLKEFYLEGKETIGSTMLANSDDYWLKGPKPGDEWGFMFGERSERNCENFSPESWKRIAGTPSGQFYTRDGMFTIHRIFPSSGIFSPGTDGKKLRGPDAESGVANGYHWIIISHVPRNILSAGTKRILRKLVVLDTLIIALFALGSWFLAGIINSNRNANVTALRKSEQLYRTLAESTRDMIFIVNKEYRFQYINRAGMGILMFPSEEEIINKHLEDLFPLETSENLAGMLQKVFRSGKIHSSQLMIRLTSRPMWQDILLVPLKEENGEVNAVIGISRDITDMKWVEKALKKSAHEKSIILDNISEHFLFLGPGNIVLWANKAAAEMAGKTPKQMVGTQCNDIWRKCSEYKINCPAEKTWETGEIQEMQFLTEDGNYWLIQTYPVKDEEGYVINVVQTVENNTERKLAEEKLRLFSQAVEEAADGIHLVDLKGRIFYSNKASEKIYGFTTEELKGKHVNEVNVDQEIAIKEILPNFQKTGKWMGELQVKHKDGKVFPIALSTSIVKGEAGEPVAIVGIIRDITERKQTERIIQDSLNEKEVLLKEVHHRVKNNLQAIYGLLSIQAGRIRDEEAINAFRSSQNHLLTMALIHEKMYQADGLFRIEFGGYIKAIAEHLHRSFVPPDKNLALYINANEVELNLDTAIPCALIVNELVTNSLKHAFTGGEGWEILIDLVHDNQRDKYELSISDNGVGFPYEEKFREKRSIGLKLVNSLAEQLSATIEIDCNRGTAFTFSFEEYFECETTNL